MSTFITVIAVLVLAFSVGYFVWCWWWDASSHSNPRRNWDIGSGPVSPSSTLSSADQEKAAVRRRAAALRFQQDVAAFQAAQQMLEVARQHSGNRPVR